MGGGVRGTDVWVGPPGRRMPSALQEWSHRARSKRPHEEEPLTGHAPGVAELGQLFDLLDSLGHRLELQRLRKAP